MRDATARVIPSPDDGAPRAVTLRGRTRAVRRLLDAWRAGGRWWRGEAPSDHYRLELEDGVTVRVRHQAGAWTVEGVDD